MVVVISLVLNATHTALTVFGANFGLSSVNRRSRMLHGLIQTCRNCFAIIVAVFVSVRMNLFRFEHRFLENRQQIYSDNTFVAGFHHLQRPKEFIATNTSSFSPLGAALISVDVSDIVNVLKDVDIFLCSE